MTDDARLGHSDDEGFMARYCRGEVKALDHLVEKHRVTLYQFLCRMTGSPSEADEIFQNTWLRVIHKPESFRGGSFKGWLFMIARNLAIDSLRRGSKQISLDVPVGGEGQEGVTRLDSLAGNGPAPDDQAQWRDVRHDIERALDVLPEEQREVFRLRMETDMSFEDIAALQGVSRNTALGRMHYATTKLRSLLQAHNPAGERGP